MIVTNIIGGLGNQMFQYAAGLALSIETSTPLAIAVDMFEDYPLHQGFELERVFNITDIRADATLLHELIGWRASPMVRRTLAKLPACNPLCGRHFVAERPDITEDCFFNTLRDVYLHGYWQSERFFARHANRIRRAFSFADSPDPVNAEMLDNISAVRSASIHIRRGDYLTSTNTFLYSQCTEEYFLSSMALLQEHVGPLKFFVFSDDPTWADEFLADKGFDCHVVAHNRGSASFNDMRLMSMCNHHIIANSSFSWWGAWLSPYVDKIVIAPREWMAGTPSSRIVPDTWLRR